MKGFGLVSGAVWGKVLNQMSRSKGSSMIDYLCKAYPEGEETGQRPKVSLINKEQPLMLVTQGVGGVGSFLRPG